MKLLKKAIILAVLTLGACSSGIDNDKEDRPYDGTWESLQEMPVPAWFDDGKIGIFIHWGPYSVIGYKKGDRGYAEHVPKMIYRDPDHYYPYPEERWEPNLRDLVTKT
jgi:alpha-L-fucosidase